MEKVGLVSGIGVWLEMRDVRNRIVHDYVLEKIAEIYCLFRGEFFQEINRLAEEIGKIEIT